MLSFLDMPPIRPIALPISAAFLVACGVGGGLPPPGFSLLPNPDVEQATNTPLPAHAATFTPTVEIIEPTLTPEPSPTPTLEPTTIAVAQNFDIAPPSAEAAALAQSVFGANLPTQLVIPFIGVDTPIVPVGWHTEFVDGLPTTVWDSPGYAAGFLVSSAAPGQGGNLVIYGHNNILGAIFRNLSSLKPGGEVRVINGAASWRYAVESVDIFQEAGASDAEKLAHLQYVADTSGEQVTLLSCWPFTGNTHRVAVIAKPAP